MTAPAVTEGEVGGWGTVTLANGRVAVTVLPAKGADIYALVDVPTGTDLLFKAPWGLQPPGAPPREGSDGAAFLENYEGGWQELFPNTNDPCVHRGRELPFHGEVATAGWAHEVVERSDAAVSVRFAVDCPLLAASARAGHAAAGRASARSSCTRPSPTWATTPEQFVWGHHCVLGAPLVGRGRAAAHVGAHDLSPSPRCGRTRPGSSPGSAAPGRRRGCAPAAGRPVGRARARGGIARRRLPARPRRPAGPR